MRSDLTSLLGFPTIRSITQRWVRGVQVEACYNGYGVCAPTTTRACTSARCSCAARTGSSRTSPRLTSPPRLSAAPSTRWAREVVGEHSISVDTQRRDISSVLAQWRRRRPRFPSLPRRCFRNCRSVASYAKTILEMAGRTAGRKGNHMIGTARSLRCRGSSPRSTRTRRRRAGPRPTCASSLPR